LKELKAAADPQLIRELQKEMTQLLTDHAPEVSPTDAGWHGIIGESAPMVALRGQIEKMAAVSAPVLILGQSGTGKDLVATVLHKLSQRRDHSLVCENCAAIPETLLESVLFGHVKGAFTGAIKDHPGHFVAAHKGSIFLDEIGEMPMAMQAKLLRVLQEGEVRPVGGEKTRKVDVRIIAATNRDLEALVAAGGFREDLFYRLNVLVIELPALAERGEDKGLLLDHFLAQSCEGSSRQLRLSAEAKQALCEYSWPGNIRQLQNEVQRLTALSEGPEILVSDLSTEIRP
jgi:transcriptional regulator with GAF, ATPase, and Fis domain